MSDSAYILIGDDLDVLDMTSSLKYLTQNILRHPLVQAADVEGPLVRLGCCSTEAPGTGWGHDATLVHGGPR